MCMFYCFANLRAIERKSVKNNAKNIPCRAVVGLIFRPLLQNATKQAFAQNYVTPVVLAGVFSGFPFYSIIYIVRACVRVMQAGKLRNYPLSVVGLASGCVLSSAARFISRVTSE